MAIDLACAFAVTHERLVVLPNPVDEKAHRAAAASPSRAPGPGPRFVAAGRLVHQKGFDRLLTMLARLPDTARLTILGDGPDRETLIRRAGKLGLAERVALPGFEAAPWAIYAGADAVVMPSRWEGMPNVALEALACGTPVIATPDAGGIAELAAAAPRGAVTLAEAGEAFVAAMRAVALGAPAELRPSLLPAAHRTENAVAAFEAILTEPRA
jgi:glycosyltransferase involved in cell wall biosynthesis